MSTLFSLLPLYFLGNLHCLGMCGPLVMWLGQHRHRYWYFLGRTLSFTLAGFLAGMLGWVMQVGLAETYFTAIITLVFGGILAFVGLTYFIPIKWPFKNSRRLLPHLHKVSARLALLMEKDCKWPAFLFGFGTLLLPCGQTLVVFSTCAIAGEPLFGLINGLVFAVITSPALLMAMHSGSWLVKMRSHYLPLMGAAILLTSLLVILRGLADLGVIPHLKLAPHFILY